jgi:hypothetical protein
MERTANPTTATAAADLNPDNEGAQPCRLSPFLLTLKTAVADASQLSVGKCRVYSTVPSNAGSFKTFPIRPRVNPIENPNVELVSNGDDGPIAGLPASM